MNLYAKIFFVISIFFLFQVEAQQKNSSHQFTLSDSLKIKAKLFDSLSQTHKLAGNPKAFGPFMQIYAYDHPGIGTYIAPLKDVNGDGYNDFAVSTSTDTTFIFFGGPNMDDKPDGFVLGGAAGLVTGDINGDGYSDIVTSRYYKREIDSEGRGLVRVYLHNKTKTMYDTIPNLIMVGRNKLSGLGYGQNGFGHLKAGDINGDGKLDLIIYSQDLNGVGTNASRGVLWIYLGKSVPDTIPDQQLIDWKSGVSRSFFGEEFQVTNVNGDQFDDLMVQGGTHDSSGSYGDQVFFLGNSQGSLNTQPDKLIDKYYDAGLGCDFIDLNGDGCPEFHRTSQERNPPFAWGLCGNDFITKQDFIDDTVITNENPDIFPFAFNFRSVGNFDGTGYNNYIIAWLVEFMGTPLGISCYLYQGGPGFHSKALAYYGVPDDEYAGVGPYPLGDITGDGIDDFATIAGYYQPNFIRYWSAIWLFKGDRKLNPINDVKQIETTNKFQMSVFPNPIKRSEKLTIKGSCITNDECAIILTDILGREVKRENKLIPDDGDFTFHFNISGISTGIYFLSVTTEGKHAVSVLSVID